MTAKQIKIERRGGLRIAADFYAARGEAMVVMANDLLTHKRWRGRYPRIAADLNAAGINALTFDYCGCGESDDLALRASTMIEDLHAAIAEARRLGARRVALWGHGLVSGLCLDVHDAGLATMVLSSATTDAFDFAEIGGFEAHELEELKANGSVAVASMDPAVRPTQVLDAQLFRDFSRADQAARFAGAGCPVLLINGNSPEDAAECERLESNRQAQHLLPRGSRLAVIDGARHSFAEQIDELAEVGVNWLKAHLLA